MGGLRELALFAGAGGGILGSKLLGWDTVCAVELAEYPRRVLLARQADGSLPRFPIWDDVRTFDGKPWRGRIDVITGGFPCQDISAAGLKAGVSGRRSGLWSEMARIIGEIRPRFVFVENSPDLATRGLGTVLGDLASMGFNAEWGVVGARDAGAPHKRDRMWVLGADSDLQHGSAHGNDARGGKEGVRQTGRDLFDPRGKDGPRAWAGQWETESRVGRVAHGVADRVDRLIALGNGQVPQCAALAFSVLARRMGITG